MKRSEILKQIKEELKTLAKNIKENKKLYKENIHLDNNDWGLLHKVWRNQVEFRHRHIARCLLRGRKYEEIEKPAESNKPDWDTIKKYQKEYEERLSKADVELNNTTKKLLKEIAEKNKLEEDLLSVRIGEK